MTRTIVLLLCIGCNKAEPKSVASPMTEVTIGADRVLVDGSQVVSLRDGGVAEENTSSGGFLIEPLFSVLESILWNKKKAAAIEQERINEKDFRSEMPVGARFARLEISPLAIRGDPQTSFGLLSRVIYTAGQAGFSSIAIGTTGRETVSIDLPSLSDASLQEALSGTKEPPPPLNLTLTLTDKAYVLAAVRPLRGNETSIRLPVIERTVSCEPRPQPRAANVGRPCSGTGKLWVYDDAGLTQALRDIKKSHAEENRVIVAAERATDLEAVVQSIDLVRKSSYSRVMLSPGFW